MDISFVEENTFVEEGNISLQVIVEGGYSEGSIEDASCSETLFNAHKMILNEQQPESSIASSAAVCELMQLTSTPVTKKTLLSTADEVSDNSDLIRPQVTRDPNNNTKVANQKYLCGECTYKTPDSGNLSRHRRVHTGTKHDCQTCGKSYKAVYDLKEHIRTVHEETKLLCEVCSSSFNTRKSLFRHKRMKHSTPTKLYNCHYCGKVFYEKGHYHGH